MKIRYALLALLSIALLGAGFLAGMQAGSHADTEDETMHAQGTVVGDEAEGIPDNASPESPAVSQPNIQVGAHYVPPRQYCHGDRQCLRSPLTARSAADFAWLRQHGYPTREDLERFAAMSDAQLEDEADTGALPAMAAYADRLIVKGKSADGFLLLLNASQRGSIYAYYVSSEHALNRKVMGGRVEAAALLRIAFLLGDDMATQEFYDRYSDYAPEELAAADRRAAWLYRSRVGSRSWTPRPQE